jgi:two-component system, sensor histidine kinase
MADTGEADRSPVSRRVLIVEDNDLMAAVLEMLLEFDGHEVDVASDGEQGIELARRQRPDVALVDIGLPGIDGYEVARRLRAAGETLYLVALTGFARDEERARALEAGFDVHFVKPGQPGEIARLVASSPRRRDVGANRTAPEALRSAQQGCA